MSFLRELTVTFNSLAVTGRSTFATVQYVIESQITFLSCQVYFGAFCPLFCFVDRTSIIALHVHTWVIGAFLCFSVEFPGPRTVEIVCQSCWTPCRQAVWFAIFQSPMVFSIQHDTVTVLFFLIASHLLAMGPWDSWSVSQISLSFFVSWGLIDRSEAWQVCWEKENTQWKAHSLPQCRIHYAKHRAAREGDIWTQCSNGLCLIPTPTA